MDHPLAGKVVIITGASSGIGAAAARSLAEVGCKLTLAARSTDKLEALAAELDADSLIMPTDVTVAADVEKMVAETVARFGQVDALLANAGIYIPGQAAEGDPDAWAHLMNVNIDGVLRAIHCVLPHMMAQKAGDILVTSSISGYEHIHWEPVYSASKHAVQSFVYTLRRQVAGSGVRVMSVSPGMVANELWGFSDEDAIAKQVADRASLRSEDVAEAILFMLSRPPHVTVRDLVILPQNQDI